MPKTITVRIDDTIKNWVNFVDYSQHEWQSDILDGNNGATIEGCFEIKKRNQEILCLDKEKMYKET